MTVKDELHELVDQLDEEAAREALACGDVVRDEDLARELG